MSENNNAIEIGIKKVERLPAVMRRAIAVTGMTRETVLPKVAEVNQAFEEEQNDISEIRQVRTLDERFERGDMFRILKRLLAKRSAVLPEQKEIWNERIHAAREILPAILTYSITNTTIQRI